MSHFVPIGDFLGTTLWVPFNHLRVNVRDCRCAEPGQGQLLKVLSCGQGAFRRLLRVQ